MPRKYIPLAIAYDFDGTLAPGNMQEHSFIPKVGMTKSAFWEEVGKLEKKHRADNILVYMGLMLEKARNKEVQVRETDFKKHGRGVPLFEGVKEWFDRINVYGKQSGVNVEHYIISSGIREMIEGTPIARKFKAIFASSFWYDYNGNAKWPALALNYTTKTQFLFRINKGSLDVFDHSKINEYVEESKRPVPFKNMVYIGDGETDIPCFRLVKDKGGYSIAVYKPKSPKVSRAKDLLKDGRVNFVAPADYREGCPLDKIVKSIIDKIDTDAHLNLLGK